jgi:hypothetical protein
MRTYANIRLRRQERKSLALAIRIRRKWMKSFTRRDAHDLAWVMFS